MQFLILGGSLLVGLGLIGYWFINADPAKIRTTAKWVGLGLLGLLVIALIFFRRFDWLMYAGLVGLPFFMRAGALFRRFRNAVKMARGPASGQSSAVRTETLAVSLDHDSGAMDGEVLRGRFAGMQLSALSFNDVLELLADCVRNDPQSVAVLESYLDAAYGPDWQERAGEAAGADRTSSGSGAMSREQALEILGLEEGADEAAIREAHRRLMMVNHPDRGGSDYLAAQINEAKEILLGS
ncbi:DnaJ domain-containing protein [Nisaea nitritireducens]|uniref:DnaJ domain-containing protein n=1 Tax=Nisaea nitritireducens TaxID=568392 RepID=UPI00186927CF|nr:DnaJ domain-containing protein [Nisaea nitritireducens]